MIACALRQFIQHDLDVLIIITNAPGRSAYNEVERRMARLSQVLSGVILPHDTFGSHLKNGKTIDTELEKRNFEAAGEILAAYWNKVTYSGNFTSAEYIKPEDSEHKEPPPIIDQVWSAAHLRSGRYFLQISKCFDFNCCSKPRSTYFEHFGRFLTPPVMVKRDLEGKLVAVTDKEQVTRTFLEADSKINVQMEGLENMPEIPFDYSCPSKMSSWAQSVCKTCKVYFPTQVLMKKHSKIHGNIKRRNQASIKEEIESDELSCADQLVNIVGIEEDEMESLTVDEVSEIVNDTSNWVDNWPTEN